MTLLQEMIQSLDDLSIEEQRQLFELIRKRRIEAQRAEIVVNARMVFEAVEQGTAKRGNFEDLKAYLLSDKDE